MARAGGPGGGSDPGNSGGGSSGPGGSGAGGGGRSSGRGGGGYGGAVGAGVDASSRGSSSNSSGFDGRDTPGAPDAADGKRASTMGRDGGRASGGGNTNAGSSAASSSNPSASSTVSQTAIDSARDVAGVSRMGSTMTGAGAMVSMDDAADEASRSFMDRMDTDQQGLSTAAKTSALQVAGYPSTVNQNADVGGFTGGLLSIGKAVPGPVSSLARAADVGLTARDAAGTLSATNDAMGTDLDDSYGTAFGEQAKGEAAGMIGGFLGGRVGSAAGRLGAMAGSGLLSGAMRNIAMSPNAGGVSENNSVGDGGSQPDSRQGGLLASASQPTQPAANAPSFASLDSYAPGSERGGSFDRYSDYATQFFG